LGQGHSLEAVNIQSIFENPKGINLPLVW